MGTYHGLYCILRDDDAGWMDSRRGRKDQGDGMGVPGVVWLVSVHRLAGPRPAMMGCSVPKRLSYRFEQSLVHQREQQQKPKKLSEGRVNSRQTTNTIRNLPADRVLRLHDIHSRL